MTELRVHRHVATRSKDYWVDVMVWVAPAVTQFDVRDVWPENVIAPRVIDDYSHNRTACTLRWRFPADRPKNLIKEEDAKQIVLAQLHYVDKAQTTAKERRARRERQEELYRKVEWLGGTVHEFLQSQALESVKYEERMASLRAEAQAAMDAEFAKLDTPAAVMGLFTIEGQEWDPTVAAFIHEHKSLWQKVRTGFLRGDVKVPMDDFVAWLNLREPSGKEG